MEHTKKLCMQSDERNYIRFEWKRNNDNDQMMMMMMMMMTIG